MRESLKRSLAQSPSTGFEKYPKGSIVLCNACSLPIFKLDAAISVGDKMGRCASAFKPISVADIDDLADRWDIDAGIRATAASMTQAERAAHVACLREMKAGDPAMCPSCGDCFVQVLSVEKTEALDRSYTVELLTIPPRGAGRPAPVRGKRIAFDVRERVH